MTIIPFLSSNGHSQMAKINRFQQFQQISTTKNLTRRVGHDQIEHFDHDNFVILGMVMVKF
jgi:hypothetical protein